VSVRLHANRLELFADGVVVTHGRRLRKGSEDLVSDHYLRGC
jgi:hypothetical protein